MRIEFTCKTIRKNKGPRWGKGHYYDGLAGVKEEIAQLAMVEQANREDESGGQWRGYDRPIILAITMEPVKKGWTKYTVDVTWTDRTSKVACDEDAPLSAIQDALQGVWYDDDKQIVEATVRKC